MLNKNKITSGLAVFFLSIALLLPQNVLAVFVSGPVYPTGAFSNDVELDDLNGDTYLDMLVNNSADNTVSVFLNNGDGTFTLSTVYPFPSTLQIAVGDVNGDGFDDLLSSDNGSNVINVSLNDGTGLFSMTVGYAVGNGPGGLNVGDFDGDTDLDVVTPNQSDNTISVLLNNGDGTFAPAVTYLTNDFPVWAVTADLDNDNDLDIAVTNLGSNQVGVFMNNGDGTFASMVGYTVGNGPVFMIAADFNNDGFDDLATANGSGSDEIDVLMNNGDGTFAPFTANPSGATPSFLIALDYDGDGNLDILNTNNISTDLTVMLGNGDGTFASLSTLLVFTNPWGLAAGDINNDNGQDIVVTDVGSNEVYVFQGILPPKLRVVTSITNDNGGVLGLAGVVTHVKETGLDVVGSPAAGVGTPGQLFTLTPGAFVVSADSVPNYTVAISGDCDALGNINLANNNVKTCNITFDDQPVIPPVLIPVVSGGGGGSAAFGKPACSGSSCDTVAAGQQTSALEEEEIVTQEDGDFFTDIKGHWAESWINKLHAQFKVNGYADENGEWLHLFKPDNQISRAELVVILMKIKFGEMLSISEVPFPDVKAEHWAAAYIAKAKAEGIVGGFEDGNFKPDQNATRAEALKMILLSWYKSSDISVAPVSLVCKDIVQNAWYAQYFNFALNKGIVSGTQAMSDEDGVKCLPMSNTTRAEAAKMAVNAGS